MIPTSRRTSLEHQLNNMNLDKDSRDAMRRELEKKETENMRVKRQRICVQDFESVKIIGRGAFGEASDGWKEGLMFCVG